MIIEVANVVSDDDCRLLTTIYDRQLHLTNARDHTGHPVLYWASSAMRRVPPRLFRALSRNAYAAYAIGYNSLIRFMLRR